MKDATGTLASAHRPPKKNAAFEGGLQLRIGALLTERDDLREEVRQLRAAAQIYSEVVRRLQVRNPERAA